MKRECWDGRADGRMDRRGEKGVPEQRASRARAVASDRATAHRAPGPVSYAGPLGSPRHDAQPPPDRQTHTHTHTHTRYKTHMKTPRSAPPPRDLLPQFLAYHLIEWAGARAAADEARAAKWRPRSVPPPPATSTAAGAGAGGAPLPRDVEARLCGVLADLGDRCAHVWASAGRGLDPREVFRALATGAVSPAEAAREAAGLRRPAGAGAGAGAVHLLFRAAARGAEARAADAAYGGRSNSGGGAGGGDQEQELKGEEQQGEGEEFDLGQLAGRLPFLCDGLLFLALADARLLPIARGADGAALPPAWRAAPVALLRALCAALEARASVAWAADAALRTAARELLLTADEVVAGGDEAGDRDSGGGGGGRSVCGGVCDASTEPLWAAADFFCGGSGGARGGDLFGLGWARDLAGATVAPRSGAGGGGGAGGFEVRLVDAGARGASWAHERLWRSAAELAAACRALVEAAPPARVPPLPPRAQAPEAPPAPADGDFWRKALIARYKDARPDGWQLLVAQKAVGPDAAEAMEKEEFWLLVRRPARRACSVAKPPVPLAAAMRSRISQLTSSSHNTPHQTTHHPPACRPIISTSSPSPTTTQHNTTQHNTTQHNTTQHNTTQHNDSSATRSASRRSRCRRRSRPSSTTRAWGERALPWANCFPGCLPACTP